MVTLKLIKKLTKASFGITHISKFEPLRENGLTIHDGTILCFSIFAKLGKNLKV